MKKKTSILITIAGALAGAMGGYLYYHYIGCASGQCRITSSPVNSTLYGTVMAGLLFNIFTGSSKTEKK
jgi:hypothetical protein